MIKELTNTGMLKKKATDVQTLSAGHEGKHCITV